MPPSPEDSGTNPTPAAAAPSGSGSTSAWLTGAGLDTRAESRRIALGLIGLAVVSFTLLNFVIVQDAEERLVRHHWSLLAANTEARRDLVRDLLNRHQREGEYVARLPEVREICSRATDAELTPEDQARLDAELSRAADQFDFTFAAILTPEQKALARGAAGSAGDPDGLDELIRRCASTQLPALGDLRAAGTHEPLMAVAVPVQTRGGANTPIAVFGSRIDRVFSDRLSHWPGYGAAAGAYLVRVDGDHSLVLSTPPAVLGARAGERVENGDLQFRAAVMAAVGVESNVESQSATPTRLWAVTRSLPEVGWGLVGQDDRASVREGMRGTLVGLLVLDLAGVAIAIAAVWFWRRQYQAGLARREVEVTRRNADRVQSILDTALDAIVVVDHNGTIVEFNPSAEKIFGRERGEAIGQEMAQVLIPESLREGHRAGFARHLRTGETQVLGRRLELPAMRADGTQFPIEISISRMPHESTPMFTAFIRDISERVESERRIQAFAGGLEVGNRRLEEMNAQLEEASRLKSEFLANTSHELRTPLNGMIGFLQLVLDGMCDSPDEERDFLKQALECSRHLLGLINDVLDIAKIESGKLSLEITPIDVRHVFDEVYTLTHVQAAQKGLELTFDPPEDEHIQARGDFGKIKQILVNLVGNSLKFTASGSIRVRAVARPDLGHVMFEIADTGIGIAPERQKMVFEKFTQGDGSTTRKYGGTGLGLAISRSLVELMGGIIGVQSDGPSTGTRMYFSLPVWSDVAETGGGDADPPGDRIEGPNGGAVVLVVEDDAIFRRFLTTLLHQHGYRTLEARHAEGGWMVARRMRPSVVVLDYALTCTEGANLRTGWDLAERMTSDQTTRHIPLIFVTGFDEELREKLRATAFARKPLHLVKPIDSSVLLEKIQQLAGADSNKVMRVLMADDDPTVAAFVRKVLPPARFHLEIATNGDQCLHFLRTQPHGYDLLLLDLMMPQVSGYDVLREMTLAGLCPELPVLVLTNFPEARNEDEKRLLERGLVLDVLPKTSVHDNPQLLPHMIEWQLQATREESLPTESGAEPETRAA